MHLLRHRRHRLPLSVAAIFRLMAPVAERDEVLEDLTSEYKERVRRTGPIAARFWAWRQGFRSAPALIRRTIWRGMTGFESHANRMQPGGPLLESWIIDFRYAARRLSSRPNYAVLAVLTIALGAGGTAAIYSIARPLLLDPLPIADEDQVGVLWFQLSWTENEFLGLRPDFPGFQSMAAYRPNGATLKTPDGTLRRVEGYAVSSELFDVLGAPALLGRTFRKGEDLVGESPAAVISYRLWKELGADPDLVGKLVPLNEVPHMIVGVMPPSFWFPSPSARIWTAAPMDPRNQDGRYTLVGRLADDLSFDGLAEPLGALTDRLGQKFEYPDPQWDKRRNPSVTPVRQVLVGAVRPSLLSTLAAMGVILLIGCANVSFLMLTQVHARAPEITIRSALGANRRRLIRQMIIESLLIAVIAGAVGAVVADAGFLVLVGSLPLDELAQTVQLDWTLVWASMLVALAAAMLASVIPGVALSSEARLLGTITTSRTGGIGARSGRMEGAIVVGEMALAVILVSGAGLLIHSVSNLYAIDSGVQMEGVAVVDATIVDSAATEEERLRTTEAMLESLSALPGVRSVAAAQILPLRNWGGNRGFRIRGRPPVNASTAFRLVTAQYFTTMGIPIRRGRNFQPEDGKAKRVVIINEAFADGFFPGEDPVGQVLEGFGREGEEIVGVVGNVRENGLTDEPSPARYMLFDDAFVPSGMSFVIRTHKPAQALSLLETARSTIGRDGRFVAERETTMRGIYDRALGPTGQLVTLVSLLGILALVLGAIGVYGVFSYDVLRRSHDYGVRMALGEPPTRVLRQVLGRGVRLVTLGSAIGVVVGLAVMRLLSSLLYGIGSTDPFSFSGAVLVLALIGMVAAFLPARRASLIDPAIALRSLRGVE